MKKGYYESVAKEILMLNELKSAYLPCSMQLEKAVSLSNEFYKNFFNQKRNKKIDKLNESTIYNRCNQMKTYQGISANGTQKSLIILPAYDNARLAITTTHEKAHTFQDTRQKNEIIPSFFEIIHARIMNKTHPGIFNDNLNYKIAQAKKAANSYISLCKIYDDETLKNYIDYMFEFLESIRLTDLYLNQEKKEIITKLLDDILFNGFENQHIYSVLYSDKNFNTTNTINNLINT